MTPTELQQAGYSRNSRRYENLATGQTIARREYVDMQARSLGWKSWADYQYVSRQAGGLGGMRSEAASVINGTLQRAERGGNIPADMAGRRAFLRGHSAELRVYRANPNDMSASGPLAKWLEALGIREQNAPYNVGDTPRVRRR